MGIFDKIHLKTAEEIELIKESARIVGLTLAEVAKHIKPGAIVIDAGTAKLGKKIVGDVFFSNVIEKVSLITPAIGGVGPMTIAMLIENIINAYHLQQYTQVYSQAKPLNVERLIS